MNIITSIFIMFLFTSCAYKMHVKIPTAQMISPEAKGDTFKGSVDSGNGTFIKGTIDFTDEEVTNPIESEHSVNSITTAVELGIVKNLDFISRLNYEAPSMYGLKLQVLGDSADIAKEGNHSFALTGMVGSYNYSDQEGEEVEWTATDEDIEADFTQTAYDFGIIYGYRFQDESLAYFGMHLSQHNLDSTKIEADSDELDGENIHYSTKNYAVGIGVMRFFSNGLTMKLEANATQIQWTRSTNETYGFANFSVGYTWL